MNDDIKKDIQSWRFFNPSDTAAQMNNFKSLKDLEETLERKFNMIIGCRRYAIPVHYDQIMNQEQEDFYFNEEEVELKPVLNLFQAPEETKYRGQFCPEIVNISIFLLWQFQNYPDIVQEVLEER